MDCKQPPLKLKQLMFITVLFLIFLLWFNRFSPDENQHRTSPKHATAPQEQMESFIAVENTKTLLISAYVEHRTKEKKVRVLAVVHRSETVAYGCLLRCQKQLHISEGVGSIHSDHFGFAYGTSDIMFSLPAGCEAPSHIAVTSGAAKFEDKLNYKFLEIKNQKAETKSFPYNFTVCLSTMYDFTNVLQFVQSLEMLQLLGVNKVVIYKTNCSPETQRVLDYYTQRGLVEVIPWSMSKYLNVSHYWQPQSGPGDLHYYGQIPALNDCIYRYMYQSKYVALHDIDELILPQTVNSWLELLPLLEKNYGANKCFEFENNLFVSNVVLPPPSPLQTVPLPDHWKNVPGLNILAHLYRIPVKPENLYTFKILVSPRDVFSATVHGLLDPDICKWVDRNIARMYHTRAKTQTQLTPEKLIYDGRLLNYSARLIPAVDGVLRESGLLFSPDENQHRTSPKHATEMDKRISDLGSRVADLEQYTTMNDVVVTKLHGKSRSNAQAVSAASGGDPGKEDVSSTEQ